MDDQWVSGLNAPKGMALVDRHLLVADLNAIVDIDTVTGIVTQTIAVSDFPQRYYIQW